MLRIRGIDFSLEYRFEPGASDDGVTMTVPLSLLNQVDDNRCDWLVPGLLADKVQALVKSLPQRMRRHLVPVPDYVHQFCKRHPIGEQREPLTESIRLDARAHYAVQAQLNDFRPEVVPKHLNMNFKLVDAHGRQLAVSRSLVQLRATHGEQAAGAFREAFKVVAGQVKTTAQAQVAVGTDPDTSSTLPAPDSAPSTALSETNAVSIDGDVIQLEIGQRFTRWPVDSLPELLEIREPGTGTTMVGFPAFVDRRNAITIEVFDEQGEARLAHRAGVRRLLGIGLRESFKAFFRNLSQYQNLVIAHARLGTDEDLRSGMADAILQRAIGDQAEPQSREAFDALLVQVKPRISLLGQELARNLESVLDEYAAASRKIQAVKAGAKEAEVKSAVQDCTDQLARLVHSGFIGAVPPVQFPHFPRYLRAIVMRLERVRADPGRDTKHRMAIAELSAGYHRLRRDRRGQDDQQLENFRWLIEELRVSLFAQSLRTPTPVSVKRLNKMLFELRALSGLA